MSKEWIDKEGFLYLTVATATEFDSVQLRDALGGTCCVRVKPANSLISCLHLEVARVSHSSHPIYLAPKDVEALLPLLREFVKEGRLIDPNAVDVHQLVRIYNDGTWDKVEVYTPHLDEFDQGQADALIRTYLRGVSCAKKLVNVFYDGLSSPP